MTSLNSLPSTVTTTPAKTTHYDQFYARGGWRYHVAKQRRALKRLIINPLQLRPPAKVIDLGCGMGLHTSLWTEFGFSCLGVDASAVGIASARQNFLGCEFMEADASRMASSVEADSVDVIFARGMSWWHYELNTTNCRGVDVPTRTREMFDLLKPGGVFVLQILTTFSGRKHGTSPVIHNRWDEYQKLFDKLGEIVLCTDWNGRQLRSQKEARRSRANIIIATRKGVGNANPLE